MMLKAYWRKKGVFEWRLTCCCFVNKYSVLILFISLYWLRFHQPALVSSPLYIRGHRPDHFTSTLTKQHQHTHTGAIRLQRNTPSTNRGIYQPQQLILWRADGERLSASVWISKCACEREMGRDHRKDWRYIWLRRRFHRVSQARGDTPLIPFNCRSDNSFTQKHIAQDLFTQHFCEHTHTVALKHLISE